MSNETRSPSATQEFNEAEMVARYKQAEYFSHGENESNIARNSTLYPVWIGNSNCFWYERVLKTGKEFRLVDAKNGSNEAAFNHEVLAYTLAEASGQEVDPCDLPINNLNAKASYNIEMNLFPLKIRFSAFNKRWEYIEESGELKEIQQTPANWVICPNKKYAAFSRDYNIWLQDLDSGEEHALTSDGEEYYQYGIPGSIWGNDGFISILPLQAIWSPDGKRLFAVQLDQRQVKDLGQTHHVPLDGSLRPQTTFKKMALPEDSHTEEYRLLTINVESGHIQNANYARVPITMGGYGGFFTNTLGWWAKDSHLAYFVDVDRYYKYARVVQLDTDTGSTKILFEEISETRVDLLTEPTGISGIVPLPESQELLWLSERSGWAHYYLYNLETGELKKALTSGEWLVRDMLHFDAERRDLYLSTAGRVIGRNPYYRDLVRVNIDTTDLTTLASSDHEYVTISSLETVQMLKGYAGLSRSVSPTGDYAVVSRSRVDEPTLSYLLDRNGKKILDLEVAELSLPDGWQWPEPVTMKAADGKTDIYGVIYRPSHFSSDKLYPVVNQSMIGHEAHGLAKSSFRHGLDSLYYQALSLAHLGFIVVQIDGRGTPYRNKEFKDAFYGHTESESIDDHMVGIKQLGQKYSCMDLNKVGIVGLNVGGSGVLRGLLEHPDFYKVGVACEIFDYQVMNANQGDMFEGPNRGQKGKYLEELVENLQGKLLLTTGLLSYVPAATTLRIVEALQRANKDFDLIVEPNGWYTTTPYQVRRSWDYLIRHLQGNEPPKNFLLSRLSHPTV